MKHFAKTGVFLLVICMLLAGCVSAVAQESVPLLIREEVTQNGPADSSVSYPVFSCDDAAGQALADTVNRVIQNEARIQDYLQVLSTVSEGSTGIRMSYTLSNDQVWDASVGNYAGPSYLSLLFSAKGKMPMGRPSQAYYPVTLNIRTGEAVAFDQLFTDPDGAREFMEAYLENEIEPQLSTYLENNQLFPVPYDRFFLDGFGRIIIAYENSQLSFLSGYSGAIAFRYSELWDYLDTSADGIPMQVLWHDGIRYYWKEDVWGTFAEKNAEWLYDDSLYGLSADVYLGQSLDDALEIHRVTTDSGYYPGGAYYEVENPVLRGTLILTGSDETQVTGLLTSRVDHFGIETGKTSLHEAESLMESAPLRMAIDETTAELYLVCPGTASIYTFTDGENRPLTFTLYADGNGVVQYIKLSFAD